MKKKIWLLPAVIGAVVLIAAAVVTAVLLERPEPQTAPQNVQLYWNVDGVDYLGSTRRGRNENGNYMIDFATNGQRERIEVSPEVYEAGIDTHSIVSLEFDENGVVTGFKTVEECTGGYYMNKLYVEHIDGNTVTCNSSPLFKGYQKTLELNDDIPVYRVGDTGPLTGMPTQIALDDEVIAIKDYDGNISVVYVSSVQEIPKMYWNINRKYDSTSKCTTRESDVTGCYTYDLVCDGEVITVKTKDMQIANEMDRIAGKILSLEFDENGYVSVVREGGKVAGGYFASWYHVTGVQDDIIHTRRNLTSNWGTVSLGVKARDYIAYDVSSDATMGQVTELQPGDLITSLYNGRGQVFITFVIQRCPNTEIYWNVDRKYDSATKLSTRTPAADGWYYIRLAVNGEQVTLKTKDQSIVQSIDARADKHFGLTVDGDVITGYYDPNLVGGTGRTFASWYDVTEIYDGYVTAERMSGSAKGTVVTGKLTEDCKIYNVSSTANMVGEETKLQVGDRIVGQYNYEGEVYIIYVVNRLVYSRIYWNVARKWDSTNSVSTRKPAEDGYYYILLAVDGKQVTYKTKDWDIVNSIDAKADKHFGLKVRGDEIVQYYTIAEVTGGGVFGSWYDVTALVDGELTVTRTVDPNKGKTQTAKLAEKCNIFDVSTAANMVGEVTSLRLGDRICGVTNARGEIVTIFVVGNRFIEGAQFYWNLERKWNSTAGATSRTPDADGWYHIKLATGGEVVTLKTQDYSIVNSIDSKVDYYFGLLTDGDVITRYCDPTAMVGGGVFGSWYNVTDLTDGVVTVERTIGGSNQGKIQTAKMSANCEIYNISDVIDSYKGEKTTLQIGDLMVGHKNADGELVVAYVLARTETPAEPDHFHCLCGGTVSGHECDSSLGWSAWTSSIRMPTSSGYYYLTTDVDLSAMSAAMSLGNDVELHICLNGHTIKGPTAKVAMWYVKNYLSISDCCGTGTIITQSGHIGSLAHIFNKDQSGILEIYGGTIKAAVSGSSCGFISVGNNTSQTLPATLNMYGGTLTGANVTGSAGAVNLLTKNAEFNMYGGAITGNTAKASGGAVYVRADTTFNMLGGTITGNTAASGAVYVLGSMSVSGSARITGNTGGNVYLASGKTVTSGALNKDASIGITMAANGVFTKVSDLSLQEVFSSDEGLTVSGVSDGRLVISTGHAHCVCGGTVSGHDCSDIVSWTAWNNTTSLPTTSGYYYLTVDVDLSARTSVYSMATNVELHLCLNGHTIKGPEAKIAIWYVKKYFSISDCAGGGEVVTQNAQNGAVMHIFNKEDSGGGHGGTFELYGGTLRAGGNSGACGILYVGNNSSQTLPCTFNMYGGTLTGGNVSGNGGAVYVHTQNAQFNMYGGLITGNTAKGRGSAVYVNTGTTFSMSGGKITGNTGGTGAVYVLGTLNLSGNARVESNTGGDIYLAAGAMTASNLKAGALFGINMSTPGIFLTGTGDLTEFFFSNDSSYQVKWNDPDMVLE